MAIYSLYSDADWVWNQSRANPVVDQDILTFCATSPHLVELAFTLADNGHTHVGDVARLTASTITDFACGTPSLTEQLRLRLQRAGLDIEMKLEGWQAPQA